MRVIKKRNYYIRGKIPYSQWPELIHRYMHEQGLTSRKFLYCFYDFSKPASCLRLMKDRSYGLTDCDLYYLDVDFFSDPIPSGRLLKLAERHYHIINKPVNPLYMIDRQPYGSGFHLHRDILSDNYLSMSVDILHHGVIMDPEPYFTAMEKLLPDIRSNEMLNIYPTDEEQNEFDQNNESAMPAIKRCRDCLDAKLPGVGRQNTFQSNYNLAPKLKKLAKKYGFDYSYSGGGLYTLQHKTEKGHIFQLVADSGPSHYDTSFSMSIQGLGFAERAAEVADIFRKEMLPALDMYWPETPDWYIPEWYPTFSYTNSD